VISIKARVQSECSAQVSSSWPLCALKWILASARKLWTMQDKDEGSWPVKGLAKHRPTQKLATMTKHARWHPFFGYMSFSSELIEVLCNTSCAVCMARQAVALTCPTSFPPTSVCHPFASCLWQGHSTTETLIACSNLIKGTWIDLKLVRFPAP